MNYRALCSTTAIGLCMVGVPAMAQDTNPQAEGDDAPVAVATSEAQEGEPAEQGIVVEGLRANLDSAIASKRLADQVVDTITLSDLGDLPTTSIADGLEFLPGVTGTRFRGNIDQISLRGLPQLFVLSTVNGRELTSGNGNRFVRYRIFPNEFFDQASIYKSPTPDQNEGGISGAINLQTPTALGYRGKPIRLTAKLQKSPYNDNNDLIGDTGYWLNGRLTKSFELGDGGDFGIVFGLNYIDNPVTIAQAYMTQFSERVLFGENVVVPNGVSYQNDAESFQRLGAVGVVEYDSNAGTRIKLDAIYSFADNAEERTFFGINNLNIPARYTAAEIVGGALQTGSVTNVQIISRTETLARTDEAYMVGANLQQDIGEWMVELDAFASQTKVDFTINRPILFSNGNSADFDFRDGRVDFTNFNRDLTSPTLWAVNNFFEGIEEVVDKSSGVSLNIKRDFNGFVSSVAVGGRYSTRSIDRLNRTNVNNDLRNGARFPQFRPGQMDPGLFAAPYLNFDLRESTPGTFPAEFALINREALLDVLPNFSGEASNADLLSRAVDNREETWAAYVRADLEFSPSVTAVIGARLINTKLTAAGFSGIPVAVTDPNSGAVTVEVPGTLEPASESQEYTRLLPSFNLKAVLTRHLQARLALAKTLARPNFFDLRLAQNLFGGDPENQPFNGSAGNPQLRPIEADQAEVSLEWYPSKDTTLTATAYYKKVDGFVADDVRLLQFGGYEFEVTSPVNLDSGDFYGVEFLFRHDFNWLPSPLDGLGVTANLTLNDTNIEPNYGVLNATNATTGEFLYDVADRAPGVEGLAKRTGAVILYYDIGGFSMNFGARYTGERVRTIGSNNVPEIARPATYFDLGAAYKINNGIRLTFQANNITEVSDEAYYAFRNYTTRQQQVGRTFFLGAVVAF